MKLFRVDSDKQQIAAIRNGDEKAFARVYEHYWKKLLAISFQHTKDKGGQKRSCRRFLYPFGSAAIL